MIRRHLIALLSSALALAAAETSWPTAVAAKDGGDGGGRGGDGGGRGGDSDGGRGGGDNSGRGGGDDSGRGRGGDDGGRGRGGDDGRGDDGGGRGRGRGGDDDGGRGRGRGRGGDDARGGHGWGSTSSDHARDAVSQGWALALSSVLPTVSKAVPGQVLEVDLRQSWTGDWLYEFLILTKDRRYREVVVDARRNQVLEIRRR
ncbi:MAG TPA: hypothetical protein VEZ16_01515 [Microvirga sp.]|nr:hypothetical protein [Microvirga sp.]